jgi:hypothetical protein
MDALAEALRAVKIDEAIHLNSEFSEPWCVPASTKSAAKNLVRTDAGVMRPLQLATGAVRYRAR